MVTVGVAGRDRRRNSVGYQSLENSVYLPEVISSHAALIPVQYSEESIPEMDRVVRIIPFNRNAFVTMHCAKTVDFGEFQWILKYGEPGLWYERPSRQTLWKMTPLAAEKQLDGLPAVESPRPVTLDTPRVWASAALTTPTNDDLYDCTIHRAEGNPCQQCTDDRADVVDSCDLVYYVVISTFQANDPFIYGAHFNGKPLYKYIRCGSREVAAAEAFYTTGMDGWSVLFSCVMREGETFFERAGPVERVDELWDLTQDSHDDDVVRVYY
ncbi:hypothetical protein GQ43DRAFT_395063 [Delitschia confertaspora ATCC 74209]|uniref:Uncharacterized protein n=1 Tax=Delitschia confertaspora ATCC 74209 TaxID=1513339 RepID=A0A9P4JMN8_9PLEO|nr:hypothetical protein GQ43DRAFT_395063 [Delitschia confertaspora ATCC 74209]